MCDRQIETVREIDSETETAIGRVRQTNKQRERERKRDIVKFRDSGIQRYRER